MKNKTNTQADNNKNYAIQSKQHSFSGPAQFIEDSEPII